MVLPLAIALGGQAANTGFQMYGANKRKRALEGVADQQEANTRWYQGESNRLANEDQAQYGDLSRQRRAGISELLAGYTAQPTSQPVAQIEGDPRFSLDNIQGAGQAAGQWAAQSRGRVGRTLGLQQAVRSNEDRSAAERLQRAQAMGGYEQGEDVRGRQAADYGALSAIRRQAMENEAMARQAALAGQQMRAGQAGSEQMLYGGLSGLAGQMGSSFLPMGGGGASGATMPSAMRPGMAPADTSWNMMYRPGIARSYGG